MIVLADGTMIYDEYTLRDFLEAVGFDCWNIQAPELASLLGKYAEQDYDSSLLDEIDSLEDEIDELKEIIESQEDELAKLKEQES